MSVSGFGGCNPTHRGLQILLEKVSSQVPSLSLTLLWPVSTLSEVCQCKTFNDYSTGRSMFTITSPSTTASSLRNIMIVSRQSINVIYIYGNFVHKSHISDPKIAEN